MRGGGGSASAQKPAQAAPLTVSQKVVNFVAGKRGANDRPRECCDIAEEALKQSGAKTSNDLGEVGKDTD